MALVGGTALAGYYAAHRRSDDMDLFTASTDAQTAAVLAVRALKDIGATLEESYNSSQYFKALCSLDGHRFTVDVVLDANVHTVGRFLNAADGVTVATLDTLFMMKAATLVSRASEKDLYDLQWLIQHHDGGRALNALLTEGLRIDGGVTAEAMLISLAGAVPSKDACGFALEGGPTAAEIHKSLVTFRRELMAALALLARGGAAPPLKSLVQAVARKLGK